MADTPHSPGPDQEAPMPKWVYAAGIVVILLALVLVGMHLAGGGIPIHQPPQ
jgi:hypothetical protein